MERLRNIVSALGLLALISGCDKPNPPAPQVTLEGNPEFTVTSTDAQVRVKLVGTFYDDLAYGNKRGIYRIRDEKTGIEYLGISGIGITEVGSHTTGKTSVQDER